MKNSEESVFATIPQVLLTYSAFYERLVLFDNVNLFV